MQVDADGHVRLVVDDAQAVYPVTVDPWIESPKVVADDGAADDLFGRSVSVSGDVACVGAYGDDDSGSGSGSTYIFTMPNTAPVAAAQSVTVDEDTAVDITLGASDSDGDPLTYSLVDSPQNGAVSRFDAAAGTLTYTPDQDYDGQDSLTFTANDGAADSNTATVDITVDSVNDQPVFTSTAVTSATQDTPYSYAIATSDVDGDTLEITAPTRPGWLTLTDNGDGTASLEGTPTNDDVGTHPVTLEVDDGTSTAEQSFDITVDNVNEGPTFVAPTPADQEVLTVVEADTLEVLLAADDPDADTLTYGIEPLPADASFDTAGGLLSWTPTWQDAGTYEWTLSVTDGAASDERAITVEVSFVDADQDGLADTWESDNGLDPSSDDSDGDGISDPDEVGDDLDDPRDTDGDGTIDALDTTDDTNADTDDDPNDETLAGNNGGGDDGCGCSSAAGPSNAASLVLVMLGLIMLRVRRRRFEA